jgi:hypothetical protein
LTLRCAVCGAATWIAVSPGTEAVDISNETVSVPLVAWCAAHWPIAVQRRNKQNPV